ncbi:MAG: GMC family oxidoreductase [Planctomycetaceae bacterium]|nr:GMC family oxidoreductase [Planctomycetaceae bacterium]
MKPIKTRFLLIGSGIAAVTLAERLLRKDPHTEIILLEAGKTYLSKDRRKWWDYVITGKAAYAEGEDDPDPKVLKRDFDVDSNAKWDCNNNRVLAHGGSTLHWGGWSLRLKPEDFHLFENTGRGANWPFGYETLNAYYYLAEHRLAVCGDVSESWNHFRTALLNPDKSPRRAAQPYPLPPFAWTAADGEMIEAFRKLGIEPGRLPIARYRKCMATGTCKYCPIGARYTAQDALDELCPHLLSNNSAKPAEECAHPYPNLYLLTESPAIRIVMDKRRAIGVDYLDAQHQITGRIEADTVVVCAGAYESPKLLLQSTSDFWPDGVGNQHAQVGHYLVSHSILRAAGETLGNEECWIQEYDFPTLMSRTYDTPEYQRHGKLFLFKNRKYPHLSFPDAMIGGSAKHRIEKDLREKRKMEVQAFLEEKGKYENYVGLGTGRTSKLLPNTKIVFHRTDAETADALSRLELLKRIILEMKYKILECEVDRPGGHHATGTCRMSVLPETGVVDADLRVHGADNLFVCSNAVMPTGAAVNPTLTLAALSLRLGDYLLGQPPPKLEELNDLSAEVPQ